MRRRDGLFIQLYACIHEGGLNRVPREVESGRDVLRISCITIVFLIGFGGVHVRPWRREHE